MFFRKLRLHLKRQDWLAITIDLLIVIIGVLLAMQASDWNQDRKDRNFEKQMVERIIATISEQIETLEQQHESSSKTMESAQNCMQKLYEQTLTEDEITNFENACFWLIARTSGYSDLLHNSVYFEFTQGQALDHIQNPKLRESFYEYIRQIDTLVSTDEFLDAVILPTFHFLHLELNAPPTITGLLYGLNTQEVLYGNPDLYLNLNNIHRVRSYRHYLMEGTIKDLKNLRDKMVRQSKGEKEPLDKAPIKE